MDFGHKIHCDVLDLEDGPEWQRQLFRFIDRSLPCFSTPARVAWIGWLKRLEGHNSLISFLIWGTIFEALYRLTLHVLGFEVLQHSPVGENVRMFQYQMLDSRTAGLCSPRIIETLLDCLEPEDRAAAERTIALAVKVRNALSHGAIVAHHEHGHLAAGHLVIKAIQHLMEVTRRHMTREAAYFRSLERSAMSSGNTVEDWVKAEDDIYALF